MISLRLKTIASLIDNATKVIDIGTDHAYLPIYLVNEKGFKHVWASEKNAKVALSSIKNINKYNLNEEITLYESDGFNNIKDTFDIAVISGMGTYTIIDILKRCKNIPKTLILQSNNNISLLREYMASINYTLVCEIVVFEHNKYYNILKYCKGVDNISSDEILFGRSNNKKYLNYLLKKYQKEYDYNHDQKLKITIDRLNLFIEKIPD